MNNNFGFNNMDDIFNQLMGNMGGFNSETRRYRINGREVTPEELTLQVLVPVFFIGMLCFFLSTVIKNGNGTAVVVIILGLIFFILDKVLEVSKWNIFLNPFDNPLDKNPAIFFQSLWYNRIILGIASLVCLLAGLYKTQNREKFI